jgi:hypothetical protein
MVHITPTPSVDLFLQIPCPITGGWNWAEHPRFTGVLASEYVYNAREASQIVRAYGCNLSRQIRPQEADRFAVLARGRVTRMIVARDEWYWASGAYRPTGEPWNTWRAAARRYWEITGTLMDKRHFRPRLDE